MQFTRRARRSIAIPDLVSGLILSFGFLVAIYTLYFRIVDDWLQKKDDKLGDIRDAKASALMQSLNRVCEMNREYRTTTEDERFTVFDFNRLIASSRAVDEAVDQFTEWDTCLLNLSTRVRSAAIYWLLFVLFANLANLVISWEEYSGIRIGLNGIDLVLPLFGLLLLGAIVFACIALSPMRLLVSRLNKLDRESQGLQTIRTWERR